MIEVYGVCIEAAQACFAGFAESCRLAFVRPDFGGYVGVLAPGTQGAPEDTFGLARAVHLGGIEEVYAGIERRGDRGIGVGLIVDAPVLRIADLPRAEGDDGDF